MNKDNLKRIVDKEFDKTAKCHNPLLPLLILTYAFPNHDKIKTIKTDNYLNKLKEEYEQTDEKETIQPHFFIDINQIQKFGNDKHYIKITLDTTKEALANIIKDNVVEYDDLQALGHHTDFVANIFFEKIRRELCAIPITVNANYFSQLKYRLENKK